MLKNEHDFTGFLHPSLIEENGYKAIITYGPDYERNKMEMYKNSVLQYIRYYLDGGRYEKDVRASGVIREQLYIGGNAYNAPAVYVRVASASDTWTLFYIHRDHLGSVTAITNSSGSKVDDYSYDPWGRQRHPANQQVYEPYGPGIVPSLMFGRGYTGHEHLQEFGLINMNARLYDPVPGRFLSPDPYVQAPDFSQSFNRYSYCLNNPLMYVDEDGEFWWMIPAIIGLNWLQGAAANNWNFNPANWDWNKTTFNIGFSTAQNGSFYAGLTWGNTGNMIGFGINSNGNPLIVGGEPGNTVSADLAKYAAQLRKIFEKNDSPKDKHRYFQNNKAAYDYMWENSFANGHPVREVSGWELKIGGVVVLPYGQNTLGRSYNDILKISKPNSKGVRMVKIDNDWYEISTHVHTHPSSGYIGLSSGDAEMYNFLKKPIHILYDKKLYEAIYHGKESGWSYTDKGGW